MDFFYIEERYFSERGPWVPPVDLFLTEDHVMIFAELPGISKEDVEIIVSSHTVEIRGIKREPREFQYALNFYKLESSYGSFTRRIGVPCDIIADEAETEFENGVLKIKIPIKKKRVVEIPIE